MKKMLPYSLIPLNKLFHKVTRILREMRVYMCYKVKIIFTPERQLGMLKTKLA